MTRSCSTLESSCGLSMSMPHVLCAIAGQRVALVPTRVRRLVGARRRFELALWPDGSVTHCLVNES